MERRDSIKRIVKRVLNIVLPLTVGFFIYGIFRQDTYIHAALSTAGVIKENLNSTCVHFPIITYFLKNFMCDMLWAYSMTYTIALLYKKSLKNLFVIVVECTIFEILLEFCQKYSIIPGTFDWWDMTLEFMAILLAIFIIYKQEGEML